MSGDAVAMCFVRESIYFIIIFTRTFFAVVCEKAENEGRDEFKSLIRH